MSRALISVLLNAAVRSLLLALAAGLVLKLFRVRNAGAKLAAWTAVLFGTLLMPLVIAVVPPLSVITRPAAVEHTLVLPPVTQTVHVSSAPISAAPRAPFDWMPLIAGAYLLVAAFLAARLAIAWTLTVRLRRAGSAVNDRDLIQRFPGVTLLESDAISVPMCTGWRRPSILLPSSWRTWDAEKRSAVLAHELSHIERRDYMTLLLAALNRCLFWFSPLSWWLDRKLRDLSEQLSDDSVLRSTGDSTRYAEIVLSFLEELHRSGSRVRWQGVYMANSGSADRRIDRILAANRKLAAPLRRSMILPLACVAVPLLYLSAAVTTHEEIPVPARTFATTALPPTERAQPVLVAQATRATQSTQPTAPQQSADEQTKFKPQDAYIIVHGDSVTMSGSREDLDRARSFRYKLGDDYIWFRQNGKAYVIRDKDVIESTRRLFARPSDETERQTELSRMQNELSGLQQQMSAKRESVRTTMPDLTAEVEKLRKRLHDTASSEELSEVQALLSDMQAKISDQHARISEQQAKISEDQAELSERMARLSEQQAQIAELQARRSNQAIAKLKTLLEEAIRKGLTEPEPR